MSIACNHIESLVLIAGLSGAGRTTAINTFSDEGFFVIDNLPVALLNQFITYTSVNPTRYKKTALLIGIDSQQAVEELICEIEKISPAEGSLCILFLDATNETLIKRYGETRRPHPGFNSESDATLLDAVQRERSFLMPLKEQANLVLDTSDLTTHDLRRELRNFIKQVLSGSNVKLRVNFVSFGFKKGVPTDCDLIFDVRFIKNPFFEEKLRNKTGLEEKVQKFVLKQQVTKEFIEKITDLLNFLLPCYVHEGKAYINIGFGCTGGKHRSVTLVEHFSKNLESDLWFISKNHRDVPLAK
ncbi:MAG: RNase adapter RapZ [Bdellovibrionales bacterium]|nr:RNase adapter RapZ [Bdellovibrionales bacterium]